MKHRYKEVGTLAEDARALLSATADVAGEKVMEARNRLAETLEAGKGAVDYVRHKALKSAKEADEAVRDYPYQSISIAVGIGALIGVLAALGFSRRSD